ncbi:HEPN/Toprim-associated domain-containing protein [Aeromonas salmonicida]|uniref:HEPN/Toprim-associated domain-containing protein n=1 Tax=Aeromonas salmonicida TaxID=645 RepID=UPI0038BB100A
MSSHSEITINGHLLIDWGNTYHEWYFDKADRIREMAKVDQERDFIGYRTTVATIRRRLHLAGYDNKSLERDFNETRELWIRDLVSNLEYYSKESITIKDDFDLFMESIIPKKIEVLRSTTINEWIQKFPMALEKSHLSFDDYYNEIDVDIPDDPLLSFMLSPLHGIHNSNHHGFTGSFFPCMQMESYALLLLGMSNDDDLCELEITDIVHGGWVDDFEDIEQLQEGRTYFYDVFESSIIEIHTIKYNTSTPILQRMIFSSIITAMEAYLSDTMKRNVLNRHAIKRRFVETYKSFSSDEIKGNNIFKYFDGLDQQIKFYLDREISFHDTKHIKTLYEGVLNCKLQKDKLALIRGYASTRHDIVHRNGRDRNGDIVDISSEDIGRLLDVVVDFVSDIDKQILDGLLETGNERS